MADDTKREESMERAASKIQVKDSEMVCNLCRITEMTMSRRHLQQR